jgi:hypothetical protein
MGVRGLGVLMFSAETIFSSSLLLGAMVILLSVPQQPNSLLEFYQYQLIEDEAASAAYLSLSEGECTSSLSCPGEFECACIYSPDSSTPPGIAPAPGALHTAYPVFRNGDLQFLHIFKSKKS